MSFRGRGGGSGYQGRGGGQGDSRGSWGRGGGDSRGSGGRGGGRGGYNNRYQDYGPPEHVVELGEFTHPCEEDLVCRCTNAKVPYFNAPVYLENKEQIGKVDEIFGPINDFSFSVKLSETMKCGSFNKKQKFFIDPMKLLPLERFLPGANPPRGGRGGGRGRGGRGGGRGGFSRGRGGGRGGGGFSRGRGGFRGGGGGGFSRGRGGRGGY